MMFLLISQIWCWIARVDRLEYFLNSGGVSEKETKASADFSAKFDPRIEFKKFPIENFG